VTGVVRSFELELENNFQNHDVEEDSAGSSRENVSETSASPEIDANGKYEGLGMPGKHSARRKNSIRNGFHTPRKTDKPWLSEILCKTLQRRSLAGTSNAGEMM